MLEILTNVSEEYTASILRRDPEDGGGRFLRNVC
jgi:hypothetical protein